MSLAQGELLSHIITDLKKTMTQKLVEFCGKDSRPMDIITGDGFWFRWELCTVTLM